MFGTLRKLFSLKPYGNNLLDGVGETWLVLAALNILSIAFCDAVAWAYFGYTTATGAAAWASAIVAGLVVLMLVGSVDAMFVMHDRTRKRAAEPPLDASRSVWKRVRRGVHRDHVAIVARIALVILTFTVTAPFLTQMFFARDIEASIKRQNEQTIGSMRSSIAGSFDRRIDESRAQLATRQRELEREIAGTGSSGRYGKGPTAEAIERDVALLQNRIGALERAKAAELQSFDDSVGNPEVLASRYGLDLVRQGPDTRARVVTELEKSESFRTTRRNIKAFLVFMFLGLVCLKLFQPESVRIYYSARLQAAYARMKAGVFDHRLDPREQSVASGMNPVRFADWYENDQQIRDDTDRLRDQTACAIERLKAQEEALNVLSETLRTDIARMTDDLASTSKTSEELEEQLLLCRQELSSLNAKITEEQQSLDDFRYDLAGDLPLRDQQLLMSARGKTVRRLEEHRAAVSGLTASLARCTDRLETTRAYEHQLRDALTAARGEAAALSTALQRARQQRAADICAM